MGAEKEDLRVVLDTNVVVSALVFERGAMSWFREAWQRVLFEAERFDAPALEGAGAQHAERLERVNRAADFDLEVVRVDLAGYEHAG